MKKTLSIACSALALMLATSTVAEARDGFYLAGRGGATWNNLNSKEDSITKGKVSKLDHVPMFSGALGYKYKYFRGEVEYVWRDDAEEEMYDSDIGISEGTITLTSHSLMFNGYIDLLPNYWISPYIGGGIGITKLELEYAQSGASGKTSKIDKNKFSWQIGGGLSIRINKCLNIDAGYRYYTLGKVEDAEVNAHEWYGGIRFTF